MDMDNRTEIMLDNIGMTYKTTDGRGVTALTSVSLDIRKGEFISLLGPSGCGKTTLLRIIADLLQPTQGTITVGGETPRQARLKQRYGIVFQSAVLYDWRTVKKNVMLRLEIMHVEKFFALIDKMSDDAVASGSPANTIKPVSADDVKRIYRSLC